MQGLLNGAIVLPILLVAAPFVAAQEGTQEFRYVGGLPKVGDLPTVRICSGTDAGGYHVGGVCGAEVDGQALRIAVRDDVQGPIGFAYWVCTPEGPQCEFAGGAEPCLSGRAQGEVLLDRPPGCTLVTVYVESGTTGAILLVA